MTDIEEIKLGLNRLTDAFNALNVRLAGQCARHEERLCRVEVDINRAFVKLRGVWGWVMGGMGFITALLTLFYFLLAAHGGGK
jgi:hypothetical protein